jgi:hypothetical protein
LFIASVLLVNLLPSRGREFPFSSYNAEPEGTLAAYLLLEELGFRVQRGAEREREPDSDSVIIALGAEYLPDTGRYLPAGEDDWRFQNLYIEEYAEEFVALMWPYRDKLIVFEEYGRSAVPRSAAISDAPTLAEIVPEWLDLLLYCGIAAALTGLLFYRQRLGEPIPPAGFSGRPPLEGVHAMAAALEKSHAYADSAGLYYVYRARGGDSWDSDYKLRGALEKLSNEREAVRLAAEIDRAADR